MFGHSDLLFLFRAKLLNETKRDDKFFFYISSVSINAVCVTNDE